jgi:ATP-dependent Clp protease ATP-binding subunit ClpX
MDDEFKLPDQKELEQELSDYLSKKYGGRIKIVSPLMVPRPEQQEDDEAASGKGGVDKIHFDMKPEELEAYLDEYVIKQEDAKAILATKICTHFNRIKHELRLKSRQDSTDVGRIKNNIILIGPTGVGKTYIVKLIAKKLGVPFVKGDATKFSETGYVGGDVEDLVRDLVREANDDIELAQYGIIYLDEVDKIASTPNLIGPDVSRTGVQRALLKPMEETEVDLKVPHDPISQIQAIEQYRKTGKRERRVVNTRNILFIMSGAFHELSEIIKKRVKKQGIGFGAEVSSKSDDDYYFKMVKAEDFIQYGFESEFIGRLPVVAVLEQLSREDLYSILKNPKNPVINAKKADFRAYGIDIRFEDEAVHLLAERAYEERTGARGLVSVLEKAVLAFEKKLPSTDIRFLVVSPEVVKDPKARKTLAPAGQSGLPGPVREGLAAGQGSRRRFPLEPGGVFPGAVQRGSLRRQDRPGGDVAPSLGDRTRGALPGTRDHDRRDQALRGGFPRQAPDPALLRRRRDGRDSPPGRRRGYQCRDHLSADLPGLRLRPEAGHGQDRSAGVYHHQGRDHGPRDLHQRDDSELLPHRPLRHPGKK